MPKLVNHNEKQSVLGLDIGSNSIGWALLELENDKPVGIIDTGVRIFNRAVEANKPIPKNAKRRQARLARRVIQRRARRKARMEKYLIEIGLLPSELESKQDRELKLNELGDPYELRAKALDEPLRDYQLGRILLHLVQRRGFLSNRKTAMGDLVDDPDVLSALAEEDAQDIEKPRDEEGQFKQQIAALREKISESGCRTLGEYLHKADGLPSKRNRLSNGGDLRTDRAMYRQELHAIWNAQKAHNSKLTEEIFETIEEIIFYQRPLKLKADRIGKCSLEPKKKRCAIARLEFQEFRYLQDINNLAYIDPNTDEVKGLTEEQTSKLLPLFEKKKTVTYNQIRKALGFDGAYQFNLERAENKKLKGNLTAIAIAEVCPAWEEFDANQREQLVEDLISYEKRSKLRERLQRHWGFDTAVAIQLCLLDFEDGYGNVSLKAIKKLLPFLRQGKIYSEARQAAGYEYEIEEANLDRLPSPPVLSNPIVNRGLNEVKRLVNAIIKVYGKPDAIRLEMARDLEMNTKRYNQFVSRQRKNTVANEEAVETWEEYSKSNPKLGLRRYPTRDQKIKYRLWLDQGQQCAYSNKMISISQLFSDQTEVDHIIPYSMCLDDSYMNKVVCFAAENRAKSQRTPIEAFAQDSNRWDQITQAVQKWDKSLYSKIQRFYRYSSALEKDFISSQLNDTRYIAREALAYLKKLGTDVTTSKGVVTSWLRHQWGLNTLISENDEKDRSDHRQHSIDAVITACLDRSFYKALVDVAKDLERRESSLSMKDLVTDAPWDGFRNELSEHLEGMVISHQTSSKITGALHEEGGVGYIEGVGAVYRKPVSEKLNLASVIDPKVKEILETHLAAHGGAKKVAFSSEHPVFHLDGRTRIKRVRCVQSKQKRAQLEKNKVAIKDRDGNPFKWHSYGNVHRANIFKDGDTYTAEFETTFHASQRAVGSEATDRFPLFSLHKNDAIEVVRDSKKEIFRVQKIEFTNRRITLIKNYLAKGTSKDDTLLITLNDENIKSYQLRKLSIDVLGKPTSATDS